MMKNLAKSSSNNKKYDTAERIKSWQLGIFQDLCQTNEVYFLFWAMQLRIITLFV